MRRSLPLAVLILATASRLTAADLPLGLVDAVESDTVTFHFLADHSLLPDDMVAVYGPGKVEKHPLTKEVIVERRAQVAKVQVLKVDGAKLSGRITWRAEKAVVEAGYDVVPLPGEASPDAPPVLTGPVPAIKVETQGTIEVKLPVADPEDGPLTVIWNLPEGAFAGFLNAASTGTPSVSWTAPAQPAIMPLNALVRDRRGQELKVDLSVEVVAAGEDWRTRVLKEFGRHGRGGDRAMGFVTRAADGSWWFTDDRGAIVHAGAGWISGREQPIAADVPKPEPQALVPRGSELYVLDKRERTVLVLAADGVLRRRIGSFSEPTDLEVGADGTVYVADQAKGGVQVFEADGSFRACLGHAGETGRDVFSGLTRIALGVGGELYALDAKQQMIQRFDRFHHRLPTWQMQSAAENAPVDLAWHPRGLCVLLAGGKVLICNAEGVANASLPPLAETKLFERLQAATCLCVDATGAVLVTYPRDGVVARYDAEGRFAGVRGPSLWRLARYATDGRGLVCGLDERSGLISMFDAEGWLRSRFGGNKRVSGPLQEPIAMAMAPDGATLAVLDEGRTCVVRFNLKKTDEQPLVFGQSGKNPGQFKTPKAVAMDLAGRTYVLDAGSGQHRVSVFGVDGAFQFQFGRYERGKNPDELDEPTLLAVDPGGAVAYIYDEDRYEVMKFTIDHGQKTAAHAGNTGGKGRDLGKYSSPVALACDRMGLLYVLDGSRRDLQAVDFRGQTGMPLMARSAKDLGLSDVTGLAVSPDGLTWIQGDEGLTGLRWSR